MRQVKYNRNTSQVMFTHPVRGPDTVVLIIMSQPLGD